MIFKIGIPLLIKKMFKTTIIAKLINIDKPKRPFLSPAKCRPLILAKKNKVMTTIKEIPILIKIFSKIFINVQIVATIQPNANNKATVNCH